MGKLRVKLEAETRVESKFGMIEYSTLKLKLMSQFILA